LPHICLNCDLGQICHYITSFAPLVVETVENIGFLSTGLSTKASKTGLVEETVENIGVLSTGLSTKASKMGLVEEMVKNIGVLSTSLSTTLDFTITITTARK